jgi:hypothetical protein
MPNRPPTVYKAAIRSSTPVSPSNNANVGPKPPPVKTGFSGQRRQGFANLGNNNVTTTPSPITGLQRRFPVAYIWAERTNTDFIRFGDEGGQLADLSAGDVVTLYDVAPNDVWVVSNSGTQKVYFIGHGDPNASVPVVSQ